MRRDTRARARAHTHTHTHTHTWIIASSCNRIKPKVVGSMYTVTRLKSALFDFNSQLLPPNQPSREGGSTESYKTCTRLLIRNHDQCFMKIKIYILIYCFNLRRVYSSICSSIKCGSPHGHMCLRVTYRRCQQWGGGGDTCKTNAFDEL
jgi:hypothetical protein